MSESTKRDDEPGLLHPTQGGARDDVEQKHIPKEAKAGDPEIGRRKEAEDDAAFIAEADGAEGEDKGVLQKINEKAAGLKMGF